MLTHTGEKPYTCDICPSKFTTKSSIMRHLESHAKGTIHIAANNTPHQCIGCDVFFNSRQNLKAHEERQGNFACHLCDVKFVCKKALNAHHALKHTIDTGDAFSFRFVCDVCGERFLTSNVLDVHTGWHKTLTAIRAHDMKN